MNQELDVFYALLKAGLWEQRVQLSAFGAINFSKVFRLAQEQSVVGLIAAGVEMIDDSRPSKESILPILAQVFSIENRNNSIEEVLRMLVAKFSEEGVNVVLVKGQGVAQCYARPHWRAAGDIDFIFDSQNYTRAKDILSPLASRVEVEGEYDKHLGMIIRSTTIELHGTMRIGLSSRIDDGVDAVLEDVFEKGGVRIWNNEGVDITLPNPDNDCIIIFTHFLKHFYKGGLGLRQICDWCRLLWTYRDNIDSSLLESRLKSMGLLSEWRAFAAYAVDMLGMPLEAMPLYDSAPCWSRKARRIGDFIISVGNFGHNRDQSYFWKYKFVVRKAISAWQRLCDLCRHALIFPLDSLRFLPKIMLSGLHSAVKGE